MKTVLASAIWSLFILAACGQDPTKDAPRSLPVEIAKAWRDAGADIGWMKDVPPHTGVYRFWEPWRDKAEAGAVPAFRFPERRAGGVVEKLPDPGTPFGLDFHCGYYARVPLKEVAKLKNLHSLCIGGVQGNVYADLKDLAGLTNLRGLYLFYLPVTDVQLKHLAGMNRLQVLDLSHTEVTDVGLKELTGLKGLRWLNLRGTEVTAKGVAGLQRGLPKCKIMTGED
jgi:hypothetical protein